ncbi:MAG TPA: glycosyltransferase family 1 protein [Rhabdochlamydiaceae bacterium]|nr:glycosyltransferase family 1 protein [Rhabdochlamydiaceae bacterium]
MRVGVDATALVDPYSGIGCYLFHLLKELVVLRKDCVFYLYTASDERHLHFFKQCDNVIIRKKTLFSFWLSIWLQTTVAYCCWQEKLDVFWGPAQAVPLLKRKAMKSILTLHDFTYLLYPKTVPTKKCLFLRTFSRWIFKKSDQIISVSQGTANRLFQYYGLKFHSIIQPPLKPEIKFKEKKDSESLLVSHGLEYGNYVISIGTLEPRKNFIKLIEFYLDILSEQKNVVPLVIVGSGGWKNQKIIKTLENAQLAHPKQVKLLGHVSDDELSIYLSGAKHFLSFSCYEGYGIPIAEARICRTPIACFDIPEMREAAEEDGSFFNEKNMKEKMVPIFISKEDQLVRKQKIDTNYLSNTAKASILSEIISKF